jgi:hypothetical protein
MSEAPKQIHSVGTKGGMAILGAGLAILAYGAVGFWLINTLPPNGGANGRLPSLYVMGAGMVVAVVGLVVRDIRAGGESQEGARRGIPASYGILGLLAILIILFLVISRL